MEEKAMKTILTPVESQRLIDLGVDPKMASMCMLYFAESDTSEPIPSSEVWKDCGKLLCNIFDEVENVEYKIVPIDSDYDQSSKEETPIFNLADILNILPKEIGSNDKIFSLNTEWRVHGDFADKHQWAVFYCDGFMVSGNHYAPELIDALYSLLIWLLEQKILVQ